MKFSVPWHSSTRAFITACNPFSQYFTALIRHADVQAELGGLIGLLVGDAVGAGYEFRPSELIPAFKQIEMVTPADFRRSHAGVPPGTWTDDGAQALCFFASLLERGQFRLTDFTARLLKWLDHGYMAVDGLVFDVGILTCDALDQIRAGSSALESGGRLESDNGNGSLMRVLPLALWHSGTDGATGYVVDTLWSAKEALHEDSFQDVVRAAIRFGHDSDTTAAVAGGLAGIRFGLSGIPGSWLAALRGYELVDSLIASFVEHKARTTGNY